MILRAAGVFKVLFRINAFIERLHCPGRGPGAGSIVITVRRMNSRDPLPNRILLNRNVLLRPFQFFLPLDTLRFIALFF